MGLVAWLTVLVVVAMVSGFVGWLVGMIKMAKFVNRHLRKINADSTAFWLKMRDEP